MSNKTSCAKSPMFKMSIMFEHWCTWHWTLCIIALCTEFFLPGHSVFSSLSIMLLVNALWAENPSMRLDPALATVSLWRGRSWWRSTCCCVDWSLTPSQPQLWPATQMVRKPGLVSQVPQMRNDALHLLNSSKCFNHECDTKRMTRIFLVILLKKFTLRCHTNLVLTFCEAIHIRIVYSNRKDIPVKKNNATILLCMSMQVSHNSRRSESFRLFVM
jgi:hypothetical protein